MKPDRARKDNTLSDFADEQWLDIRSANVPRIMRDRLDLAAQKVAMVMWMVTRTNPGLIFPSLKTDYDDGWVGRYHAVESDLKTVNINPSIAFKVNDALSLGVGLNVQYADILLSSAIDFGAICVAALGGGTCASLSALP